MVVAWVEDTPRLNRFKLPELSSANKVLAVAAVEVAENPSTKSALNAYGEAVKRLRGVISESLSTVTPRYSASVLKSTDEVAMLFWPEAPRVTENTPLTVVIDTLP